jgi:hypothetical protein
MDTRPARLAPVSSDEDDFAEPEIPEYLLAERRRNSAGRGGRGQGGRGVRSAYASAVDRERYGRGTSSRYPEPARQPQSQAPRHRDDRPVRQSQAQPQGRRGVVNPRPERNSSEPWSEVPPELEEILRAQLSTKLAKPAGGESAPRSDAPVKGAAAEAPAKPATRSRRKPAAEASDAATGAASGDTAAEAPAKPATRSRRKAAAETGDAGPETEAVAAPKKRAPARKKTTAAAEAAGEALFGGGETGSSEQAGE